MSSILNNCDSCIKLVSNECVDIVIAPSSGLAASTNYKWFLSDSLGNQWTKEATTDVNKKLTILADDLPEGLLVIGSQPFSIFITDVAETGEISLTIDGFTSTCIELSLQKLTDLDA